MRVCGFLRLLISAESIDTLFGKSVMDRFTRADVPIRRVSEGSIKTDQWSRLAGTLIVLSRPAQGWITPAQHGTLAVRSFESYLHPITGCQAACTYCYLQARAGGRRPLRFHVRVDELLEEVDAYARSHHGSNSLFCTGELADSLLDAELFPVGAILATRFAVGDLGRLELRTKASNIESLLNIKHDGRTTVAFSLSPANYIRRYEPGTASLEDRIQAACALSRAGYSLAFNFEPLILRDGWELAYNDLFVSIARALPPSCLDHVSVGCLRWSQQLAKSGAFKRHHHRDLVNGEWIEYRPNKLNGTVAKPLRLLAYDRVREMLHDAGIRCTIWWSLEEPDVVSQLTL